MTLKQVIDSLGAVQKAGGAAAWLGGILIPFLLIRSQTMRTAVIGGVVLGGALGLWFTVTRWSGKGRGVCLAASKRRTGWLVVAVAVGVLVQAVLQPAIVRHFPSLESTRELLLEVPIIPNALMAATGFAVSYLLLGAIVLSSRELWEDT